MGLRPYGATGAEPEPAPAGNPILVALRVLRRCSGSKDFWLLFGSFFVCGLSTNGLIGTHLIAACIDNGIAEVSAAGLLAMMGIFDIAGTTGSGWLSDRYDNRRLLCMYYGLRGLSLIYLPYSGYSLYGLSLFAVFYGLDWLATVPPTLRLTTDIFGKAEAPIVFGWILDRPSDRGRSRRLRRRLSSHLAGDLPPGLRAGRYRLRAHGRAGLVDRTDPGRGRAGSTRTGLIRSRHCRTVAWTVRQCAPYRYLSNTVSCDPSSATKMASSLAGSVVLALAETAWWVPGGSVKVSPAL